MYESGVYLYQDVRGSDCVQQKVSFFEVLRVWSPLETFFERVAALEGGGEGRVVDEGRVGHVGG